MSSYDIVYFTILITLKTKIYNFLFPFTSKTPRFSIIFLPLSSFLLSNTDITKIVHSSSGGCVPCQRCGLQVGSVLFIIISSSLFSRMDSFPFSPLDENEEEKHLYPSPDSLSPTPSPQPFNSHLHFTQNIQSPPDLEPQGNSVASRGGRRGRKSSQQVRGMNRGHWSTDQNKRYHWFLEIHYQHFVNRHMRRMDKIFKSMELFVGTRQAEQCRSHHQKMEKKYHNFIAIIANLRKIHYSSTQIEPLLNDMNQADVFPNDGLASLQHLKQLEAASPLPPDPIRDRKKSAMLRAQRFDRVEKQRQEAGQQLSLIKEEQKQQVQRVQEEKEQGFHGNMLDQSHNNIGQLSLMHEGDSCLFACFFK